MLLLSSIYVQHLTPARSPHLSAPTKKSPSAPVTEHAQQLPGVHPLLLGHLLHVEAHVLQELDDAHLLSRQLVTNGRAGGIAVRPRAAVHQMQWATPGRGRPVGSFAAVDVVVVLEASVPAVEGSGQRGAFNLNVRPVAAGTGTIHRGY